MSTTSDPRCLTTVFASFLLTHGGLQVALMVSARCTDRFALDVVSGERWYGERDLSRWFGLGCMGISLTGRIPKIVYDTVSVEKRLKKESPILRSTFIGQGIRSKLVVRTRTRLVDRLFFSTGACVAIIPSLLSKASSRAVRQLVLYHYYLFQLMETKLQRAIRTCLDWSPVARMSEGHRPPRIRLHRS